MRDARIAVISTASSLGPLAGEMYRRVFGELGAAEVHPIHAMTRAQATIPIARRIVHDSTGIFLTGGNQLRLSSTIGGTAAGSGRSCGVTAKAPLLLARAQVPPR